MRVLGGIQDNNIARETRAAKYIVWIKPLSCSCPYQIQEESLEQVWCERYVFPVLIWPAQRKHENQNKGIEFNQ